VRNFDWLPFTPPLVASSVLHKDAFNEGMSSSVFVFYRHAISILFLVPISFVLER
jgi:hypothetical protein